MLHPLNYYQCESCDVVLSSFEQALRHLRFEHTASVGTQYEAFDVDMINDEIENATDSFVHSPARKRRRRRSQQQTKSRDENFVLATEITKDLEASNHSTTNDSIDHSPGCVCLLSSLFYAI